MSTDFADEEIPSFDQSPRPAGSPSAAASTSADWEWVELPKPAGLRPAYVTEAKILDTQNGPVMVINFQIADMDFPPSQSNRPIALRLRRSDVSRAKDVAAALGVSADSLKTEAGRSSLVGKHCRVFVTLWKDQPQIANFAPSWAKQGDNVQFFDHIKSLGIADDASYKQVTKDFCGVLPPA